MNEKIKQLAQQAGVIALSENGIAPPLEKFAELIVRDCAMHMDKYADRTGDDLLLHFGVKK